MDILLIESTLFGGVPTTTAPAEVSDTLLQGLILLLSIRYIIFKSKRWDTSEIIYILAGTGISTRPRAGPLFRKPDYSESLTQSKQESWLEHNFGHGCALPRRTVKYEDYRPFLPNLRLLHLHSRNSKYGHQK